MATVTPKTPSGAPLVRILVSMKAWLWALAALAACGSSPHLGGSPDGSTDGVVDAAGDAAMPPGFQKLITRTWSLVRGSQNYFCTRIQVPSDMWVTAFRQLAPTGTHHMVVTFENNDTNVAGDYSPCDATTGTANGQMIFAAGLGTPDVALPAGVAVHLAAGQWINLNLHALNATDSDIADAESGVLVKTVPQSQVVHEADMMFSGTQSIDVPSDGNPHTATGGCTAPTDWHVFALWPHMNQSGTHMRLVVNHAGTQSVMLDTDYQLDDQREYPPLQDMALQAGDQIVTTCTYVVPYARCSAATPCAIGTCNTSDQTCYVTAGALPPAEECLTGMFKYPAGGTTFGCVSTN